MVLGFLLARSMRLWRILGSRMLLGRFERLGRGGGSHRRIWRFVASWRQPR